MDAQQLLDRVKDPVIAQHCRVDWPGLYVIASDLQPVSIRDQGLRGYLLIKRLLASDMLTPGDTHLLIIGAGIAGTTAAVTAACQGVDVTLIDQGTEPFSTLARARTRILDYRQYEWPRTGWRRLKAWHGQTLPFRFETKNASDLVSYWRKIFSHFVDRTKKDKKAGTLTFTGSTTVDPTSIQSIDGGGVSFVARHKATNIEEDYSSPTVLWCGGFGEERHRLNDDNGIPIYTSYPYWSGDQYEKLSKEKNAKDKKILISGGGDGALQDYLRVVTGIGTPREIYEQLQISEQLESSLRAELLSLEIDAQRAFCWSGGSNDSDGAILSFLMQRYEEWSEILLHERTPGSRNLQVRLAEMLRKSPTVCLAIRRPYLGYCFPLNRLLTTLIAKYLQGVSPRKLPPLVTRMQITGIDFIEHMTTVERGNPDACFDNPHVIRFQDTSSKWKEKEHASLVKKRPNLIKKLEKIQFDATIIRHGVDTLEDCGWMTNRVSEITLSQKRHLLPAITFEKNDFSFWEESVTHINRTG